MAEDAPDESEMQQAIVSSFPAPVLEALACPICAEPSLEIRVICGNSHSVCPKCITETRASGKCPECRCPLLENPYVDRGRRDAFMCLPTKCTYNTGETNGCQYQGTWGQLATHLKEECPCVVVSCRHADAVGCTWKGPRRDEEAHSNTDHTKCLLTAVGMLKKEVADSAAQFATALSTVSADVKRAATVTAATATMIRTLQQEVTKVVANTAKPTGRDEQPVHERTVRKHKAAIRELDDKHNAEKRELQSQIDGWQAERAEFVGRVDALVRQKRARMALLADVPEQLRAQLPKEIFDEDSAIEEGEEEEDEGEGED